MPKKVVKLFWRLGIYIATRLMRALKERDEAMFLYDAVGILFLILSGAFLLFLPLATGGMLLWALSKVKSAIQTRRRAA